MVRTRRHFFIVCFFLMKCALLAESAFAHEGWGIVVDQQQQVYFSDIPTNTIWKVTTQGQLEAVARNKHTHALVLDQHGNLYGTHHDPNLRIGSVWMLARDGRLTDLVAPTQNFPLHLQSFMMDREGNMFSENPYRPQDSEVLLLLRTPAGQTSVLAGSSRGLADGRGREAKFTRIDGMSLGLDGSLYITDGAYVRRVTLDGVVTTLHKEPLTTSSWDEDLMGLAVDQNAYIYVADYSGRRVLELWPDGKIGRVYETGGLFWSPTGVTINAQDLYLLEHLRMPLSILGDLQIGPYARVRKMSKDGSATHIVTVWGTNTRLFAIVVLILSALLVLIVKAWRRRRRRRPAVEAR
jgi:sugar lactone lactonase YvrE